MKGIAGRDQKHLSVRICFVLKDVKKKIYCCGKRKGCLEEEDVVIKMLKW